MVLRVGSGYDVHQLVEGRKLVLGGVSIPHDKGCLAHSDGDVLIHALCDALLGAANMRDIGVCFPDSSSEYKNIDSTILLKRTIDIIATKGYVVSNVDSTICLQKPKLRDFIPAMCSRLAEVMGIDVDCVSVKATTTEKLGFVGREEGVEVHAVVLIVKH
jgi:2-C-methyl-D-erythritol 2,4-cyclodiphosphate synthase